MSNQRGNLINGEEVLEETSDVFRRMNPADERQLLVEHALADEGAVRAAVDAARTAHARWADTPAPRRASVLHQTATLLEAESADAATEIAVHAGKTLADAHAEVARTASLLRFFAEQARASDGEIGEAEEEGTLIFTRREPLGVVALITPWNFPLAIPARKLAPALAFGNTVVIKPSPLAAMPMLRLATILKAAGLPDGCLNVVVGEAAAGRALVQHEDVRAMSFTGSTRVGRLIVESLAHRLPVQAEMGGHSPVVVLADADPAIAADVISRGAFAAAGQTCTATRRVVVEEPAYEAVRSELISRARALRLGPGIAPDTDVPPLIASERREQVEQALEHAQSDGATVVVGGVRPAGELAHGAYLAPTILDDVDPEMPVAQTEVFGPVVSLLRARGFDDAVALAAKTEYGLSAAIVTNDMAKAMAFVASASTGMVHVNRPTVGSDPQMPFGGARASSFGPPEQGRAAQAFYTHTKTVYLHT